MRNLFIFLFAFSSLLLQAQSFVQIGSLPPPITDVDYDQNGVRFAISQDGKVYKGETQILTVPCLMNNEFGLVGLEVKGSNLYFHVSGVDTVQRVISYNLKSTLYDTLVEVSYKTIPFAYNHVGGDIVISDGYLYCSFGYGIIDLAAQELTNYRGKLLAINLEDKSIGIASFGLRNPFRFDVDGEYAYIGDVGSKPSVQQPWEFEEINYFNPYQDTLINYGWPCFEGDSIRPSHPQELCEEYEPVYPIYTYTANPSRAITGGVFWQDNWYFCDQYTRKGGYVDTNWHVTIIDGVFPAFVTGMTVNPLSDKLILCNYNGKIYQYVPPIIVNDPKVPPGGTRSQRGLQTGFIDMYGEYWTAPPTTGIYYVIEEGRTHFIFIK